MKKFSQEQSSNRGSWSSLKQQQQETLYTGLGAGCDTNYMKYSLGITAITASPTTLNIALFGGSANTNIIGSAKSGFTNEWTTTTAASTVGNYARTFAGTANSGIGASEWTVNAYVNATGTVATNATQVSFAATTGATNNYLTGVALVDSGTYAAGNIWWMADVTPYVVVTGIQVAFFIGDISLTLN